MRIIKKPAKKTFSNIRKPVIRKAAKKNFSRDVNEIWDAIIENGIATEDECQLVTDINGYSERSLNDIIYARTGYHDIEQYLGESEEEKDFADNEEAVWVIVSKENTIGYPQIVIEPEFGEYYVGDEQDWDDIAKFESEDSCNQILQKLSKNFEVVKLAELAKKLGK